MTEPSEVIRSFLTNRLTDPNSANRPLGDSYISADWPQFSNLVLNNFPRISVIKPSESADVFGLGSTTTYDTYRFQASVWTKPDMSFTISSTVYEGKSLAIKLARDVTEALRLYWITDLAQGSSKYLVYKLANLPTVEIDMERRYWHLPIDISFEAVRV